MITYKIYSKVIGLAVAALTLAACSDTWDDHYDKKGEGTNDATLWQAITQKQYSLPPMTISLPKRPKSLLPAITQKKAR